MPGDDSSYYLTLQNPTVAEVILRYLALEGVDRVFGLPGAAVMHLLYALGEQRDKFQHIVCRQETGAAYIADGYARISRKLGVVLVTSGPGATNALTGTMNAQNSGTSLLTITGEVAEAYFGMGYLQEGIDAGLDVDLIYRSATRYSSVITAATNFQTLFTQALRDALSLPRQAVHISLPSDVAGMTLEQVHFPKEPENYRASPQGSDPRRVRQALDLLVAAERPLIFLGNGSREALAGERLASFTRFLERFAIPVMTTPNAKAVFPESHPLSLRNYGLAGCEWPQYYLDPQLLDPQLPAGYDALLVLGSTLGELATNLWNPLLIPDGPFIQVDLDQGVIARAFPVQLGIVAEIGATIDELVASGESLQPDEDAVRARRELIERIKRDKSPYVAPAKRDSDATPIPPETLMTILNEGLPEGAHVFVDAGNCVGWCMHYLTVDPPTRVHSALAMGPMGFGVGAVIGGKMAAPDCTCVAVVGDGAFLMHGSEVSTAARYGVGAVWVVLNDNELLMVTQGMTANFPDLPSVWQEQYQLGAPDLAKFAAGLGADAYDVRGPDDLRRVLPQAIAGGEQGRPQVIVAHIDPIEAPPYPQPPKQSAGGNPP